jgi:hypothetical protein
MAKLGQVAAIAAVFFVCGEAGRFDNIPGSINIGDGLAPVYARELETAIQADREGNANGKA